MQREPHMGNQNTVPARAASGGGGTAIISPLTAANLADHQSRDPFGCMHLAPDKLQNSQV
jgi:hypothetical protein